MKVKRTEQIWIKEDKNVSRLCHLSKNLYNEANYIVRQNLFESGVWIRYYELWTLLKESENYKALPSGTAQQTLRIVDKNWSAFFKAIKEWKKHPEKFLGRPKIPKYKKKDGEFVLVFTNIQAKIKDGLLILPKKVGLELKTRIKQGLREVRVIPKGVGYVVEIVFEKEVNTVEKDKNKIAGIDLGVRNLITMTNNISEKPIVVKGGIVKSINQFYNKEKARIQSVYDLQGVRNGKKMKKLSVKRERKLNDFFHKVSRFVVEWCIEHEIGTLVIGHSKNWKQETDLGKRNNQIFEQIPFMKLIQKIGYKAEEEGIQIQEQEESHTSKCSFLDSESIEHHEEYSGKRISRGLFRSSKGILINADVQGAYNIIKKAVPKAFTKVKSDGIEGVELHPLRCSCNIS